jgi:hypothetical protein
MRVTPARKRPQTILMSVITAMAARKPLIYAVSSMTMNMTMTWRSRESVYPASRSNPINTGRVTTVTLMNDDDSHRISKYYRRLRMAATDEPGIGDARITAAGATSGLGRPHEPALEQLVDGATMV